MALIFFGTPEFAVLSLRALIDEKENIALVITQPDRVKGRGHVLSSPPVKELALSYGLRVMQPAKIRPVIENKSLYDELSNIKPEFIVVVAYGKVFPDEALTIPKSGYINVHASLLPKYRGAAPIQWALINGERTTGITTMLVDKEVDTGDILMKAELEIRDADNAETLSLKLAKLGAKTLIDTLKGVRSGKVKPAPQKGYISYAPPLKKEDGKINWSMTAVELFNFIRGMYPWPAAFCYLNKERIKIIKAKPLKEMWRDDNTLINSGIQGMIVRASYGELIVETGEGFLSIEELQPEGKKIMSAAAFMAGRRLRAEHERFF